MTANKILRWIAALVVGFISCIAASIILSIFWDIVFGEWQRQLEEVVAWGVHFLSILVTNVPSVAAGIYFASWLAPMNAERAARILARILRWIFVSFAIIVSVLYFRAPNDPTYDIAFWHRMELLANITATLSFVLGGYLGVVFSRRIKFNVQSNPAQDVLDGDMIHSSEQKTEGA